MQLLAATERKIYIKTRQSKMDVSHHEMESEKVRRARQELEKRHRFAIETAQLKAKLDQLESEKTKISEEKQKAG